jgi:hypothetical protein
VQNHARSLFQLRLQCSNHKPLSAKRLQRDSFNNAWHHESNAMQSKTTTNGLSIIFVSLSHRQQCKTKSLLRTTSRDCSVVVVPKRRRTFKDGGRKVSTFWMSVIVLAFLAWMQKLQGQAVHWWSLQQMRGVTGDFLLKHVVPNVRMWHSDGVTKVG